MARPKGSRKFVNLIGYTIAAENCNNYKRFTIKFKKEATHSHEIYMDRPSHGLGDLSLASTHTGPGSTPAYPKWDSQQEKRRWHQN
jgi:hypothetical protein